MFPSNDILTQAKEKCGKGIVEYMACVDTNGSSEACKEEKKMVQRCIQKNVQGIQEYQSQCAGPIDAFKQCAIRNENRNNPENCEVLLRKMLDCKATTSSYGHDLELAKEQ